MLALIMLRRIKRMQSKRRAELVRALLRRENVHEVKRAVAQRTMSSTGHALAASIAPRAPDRCQIKKPRHLRIEA